MLVIRIPDVTEDVLEALRRSGVDEDALVRLRSGEGGVVTVGLDDEAATAAGNAADRVHRRQRGRPRSVDDETAAHAKQLMAGGASIAGAARSLGVGRMALGRAVGPVGAHRGRDRALTPEQIALVQERRRQRVDAEGRKWTLERIADELGVSVSTVRRAAG